MDKNCRKKQFVTKNGKQLRNEPNSRFALDFHEEVPEVGGGGGEDQLVGGEGGSAAAGQRHVGQILAAEDVPRQTGELVAVVAPLQPQLGRVLHPLRVPSEGPVWQNFLCKMLTIAETAWQSIPSLVAEYKTK